MLFACVVACLFYLFVFVFDVCLCLRAVIEMCVCSFVCYVVCVVLYSRVVCMLCGVRSGLRFV